MNSVHHTSYGVFLKSCIIKRHLNIRDKTMDFAVLSKMHIYHFDICAVIHLFLERFYIFIYAPT